MRIGGSLVDDQDELLMLVRVLWRRKWLIFLATFIATVIATVIIVLEEDKYRATVTMAHSEQPGVPSGSPQLGALIGLAGIKVGDAGEFETHLAFLSSAALAREFIEEKGILGALLDRRGFLQWRWGADGEKDIRDAVDRFRRDVLDISSARNSSLVTISVTWSDPDLAADWANAYVEYADRRLRSEASEESLRNLSYLRKELADSSSPVMQASIGQIIESEMQKLMLVRGRAAFAFKVVDSAVTPRAPVLGTGVLVGAGLVLLAFLSASIYAVFWSKSSHVSA